MLIFGIINVIIKADVTGSIEGIRCIHMLEHLTNEEVTDTLAEFFRVLAFGNSLMVEVPDLRGACRLFLDGEGEDQVNAYQMIYGAQSGPGMFHYVGFTWERLLGVVVAAGFEGAECTEVRSYGLPGLRSLGWKE